MNAFFAVCPRGFENPLAHELTNLGAHDPVEAPGGVEFRAEIAAVMKMLLWSRLASRILMPIANAPVESPDDLYELAKSILWKEYVQPDQPFAVHVNSRHRVIDHSRFAALRIKDAVMDTMRPFAPTPDPANAQVFIYGHIDRKSATIGLDLAGKPLHERGYRKRTTTAPLKENLAAGLIIRSEWNPRTDDLLDPFCGSGTLLIEAALMAADIAPGMRTPNFALLHHPEFDRAHWNRLMQECEERRHQGISALQTRFFGYDMAQDAITATQVNAKAAGVGSRITVERRTIRDFRKPQTDRPLTIVTNPPYGERLDGPQTQLLELYRLLGDQVRAHTPGSAMAVITSDEELAQQIDRPRIGKTQVYNGPLQCGFYRFSAPPQDRGLPEGAQMVANRITKNQRRLKKALRDLNCYRIYDADIPEYSVAVDVYDQWVVIQEYQAPKNIPEATAAKRFREAKLGIMEALDRSPGQIFLRQRTRQQGKNQYDRFSEEGFERWLQEDGLKFKVNLTDYLDTGIFLDHRELRRQVRDRSRDADVLNLFCYTAVASCYAAAGGARSTTSVDLSNTYVSWARENLEKNGCFEPAHTVVRADCLQWLQTTKTQYDLIFCDPPTFSNSKSMRDTFDVQRDHVGLLEACMKRLRPSGVLLFSNNFRRFRMDDVFNSKYAVTEISDQTRAPDFERSHGHRAFEIRHKK